MPNKTGRPVIGGATLVASVSFTSNLAFYIHIFGDKKKPKKIEIPTCIIIQQSPRLKAFFYLFFVNLIIVHCRKAFSDFFWLKW